MKNLIEIAQIITKKKIRKIEIFDEHYLQNKNSKFNDFYEALIQGKFKNDRDAASHLYQSTPKDDKYRQLKSRFRKRLLNTLFFLDVNRPSASNYDQAYFSCNKEWTLVKILLTNQAQNAATTLAEQILTTALRFKFADVIVNSCRILREQAAISGDYIAFEAYDQHIKQYANVLDAEIRSEEFLQRVVINYHKPPSKREDITERIDIYCQALDSLTLQYDSPVVRYNKYLVWTYRYEILAEYSKMLRVIQEAEQYMQENPDYYQSEKINYFYQKKIAAHLHLMDKNGVLISRQSLEAFTPGNKDWYTFQEYRFLLSMQVQDYACALETYTQVTTLPKFKRTDSDTKDKWEVFGYYLNYAVQYLMPYAEEHLQTLKSLKIKKVNSEHFEFTKEEFMYDVHHVIVQILFVIESGKLSVARDLIINLKPYINRQLRKDEYFRVINFLRLLQQLQKAEFQLEELSNVEKYENRLTKESAFSYRGLVAEIEVIRYEHLWTLILERLKA